MRSTRHRRAVAALALVAAGCSAVLAAPVAAGTSVPADPASAAAADPTAFPLTLTNRLGDVTIEAPPTRIVALGTNDVDIVYALGLTPVAIAANVATGGLPRWLADDFSTEGVEVLQISTELSLEAIAALEPDVILASPFPLIDAYYDSLSDIAPVVADTDGVLSDTWQERALKVGRALGREAAAADLVAAAEADIVAFAERYPGLRGKTYTLSWARAADQVAVMAADDITAELFGALGLSIAPEVLALDVSTSGAAGTGAATVSLETIDLLDADAMIVAYNDEAGRAQFEESPVFQNVPAVAAGRYLGIDISTVVALRGPSAVSIAWAFDQLEPLFQVVAE